MTDTPRPGELDLARLRFKYETILALRLRAQHGAAPVAELRALSHEFPGALRALDLLTLAEVHDRIDRIVNAELDPAAVAPWMLAELMFAQTMRGAKAVKAWLRGRKHVDAELHARFMREAPRLQDAELALVWSDDLATIAHPPGGRLVPLAIARVAAMLGTSHEEAVALLDQDLLGVEAPLDPLEPPPAAAEPEPLPPLPSDFLLELSPAGAGEDEDDEDESDDVDAVDPEPEGFDDE